MSTVCDHVCITLNKNTVPGDRSAFVPGGVRIGTPALTTRGFVESDFEEVGKFLHNAVQLTLRIDAAIPKNSTKKLSDFKVSMLQFQDEIDSLRKDVVDFAGKFPIPGRFL